MSNATDKNTRSSDVTPIKPTKENFLNRYLVIPIKKHPKLAAAIAGGVALVVGTMYLSRNDFDVNFEESEDDTFDSEDSDTVA